MNVEWILAAFGKRKTIAIKRYKAFVSEGKGQASPWALLQHQLYLGSEDFIQRRPKPKALEYYESSSQDRNSAIVKAYRSGGYTLKEIGHYFGVDYSTVSGMIKNHK